MRPRWLNPALAIASGLVLALFAYLVVRAVAYPYQTSYVEGYLLDQAVRVDDGTGLYRPLGDPAWIVDNFPPLYPLLLAPFVHVFGPSFAPLRVLTAIAVVGLAALTFRWHRARGLPPVVALSLVALWLASPHVLRRALLARMDFAAILLAAAGVFAYFVLSRRHPKAAPYVSAVLFALALGLRQTMLAAPLALVIMLSVNGKKRDALTTSLVLLAIGTVAVLVLQASTDGRFLRHVLLYNTGPWSWRVYASDLGDVLRWEAILLVLAIPGVLVLWKTGDAAARTVVVWTALAALLTFTAGKVGSSSNHFLEILWLASLSAGSSATWIAARLPRVSPSSITAVVVLVALVVQVPISVVSGPVETARDALGQQESDGALVELLRNTDGPILSENAGALVQSGHDVLFEPRTFHELHRAGLWDDKPLVQRIQNRTYALLVLDSDPAGPDCLVGCRFTPEVWAAIEAHYRDDGTIDGWQLWRPSA